LLHEAEELYDLILRAEFESDDGLHSPGAAANQTGQGDNACARLARALDGKTLNASLLLRLGKVLEAKADFDKAAKLYRRATLLEPDLAAAYHQLGNALLQQGNLTEAAASLSRCISIKPDSPEAINCLGSLLEKAGRPEQSVVCYQKAISLKADYAEAHNNLGNVLKHLGRLDEAVASSRQAVFYRPDLAAAHCNLGSKLIHAGKSEEAIRCLKRAIELEPLLVEAHVNLGNAFRAQGLLDSAIHSYKAAIKLVPGLAIAYNNLADLYRELDMLDEAVATFKKALEIDPACTAAYSNLLYLCALTRHVTPETERLWAQGWEKHALTDAERVAARERAPAGTGAFSARPREGRQLRIGVVSAELGSHAVAEFLEPFLQALDRSRFHLTLFPTCRRTCARSERFRSLADSYIPLTELSDSQAADRIRAEQVEVLIDTTGHTCGGRLGIFAHRAAPVQCAYIGYWGTTGLTEMDWIICDPYLENFMETHFTEKAWRMPQVSTCYRGDASLPESGWTPDQDGTVWLGSFNKYSKVRRDSLRLWAKVLCALPESKLLLEDRADCEEESHHRILTILSEYGVGAERVTFAGPIPEHARHMVLYDRLDIALDTIPFNSGTTAFDALWMGVPIVALEGNWVGGRLASSALKAFNHLEWIAQNEDEYVSIVCSLARDVDGRKSLRNRQRAEMAASPLCDAAGLARSLEEAFEAMYQAWLTGAQREISPVNLNEAIAQ
jgi:predicted O-linked N-acetylglucosamine transferase (SPINDLY family)